MRERIGFYICHCGINIASKVRCDEVAEHIGSMPGVVVSRGSLFMCSDPGQELIERDVAEHRLSRVVVASCSPRMHESTFRAVTARAGLNPYRACHHVCVREHVSWVHDDEHEATQKAKILCRAGILRVSEQEALEPGRFRVNPTTLVIGGGIAGMQAALDIASAGHRVVLVERSPTLGGHMLQYDKTFPTLDCAACIGTPKMVSVGQSKNIELLTHARVESLSGSVGNYRARVRKRARFVNEKTCTGCGDCASVCPVRKPSEWDVGTQTRSAVYRPFPQAVPISYLIDKHDRAPCVQTCPAGTNVQGYVALVKEGKLQEATALIMERLPFPGTLGRICPAPCEAQCRREQIDAPLRIRDIKRAAVDAVDWATLPLPAITPQDPQQRVAVIGAGPAGLSAAYFLLRMGYPVTVLEAEGVAGGMMRTGVPDYRLPPHILDRELDYLRRLGLVLQLNTPVGAGLTVDHLFEQGFKAVFVATGAHADVKLGVEGEEADGVRSAIALLKQVNLEGTATLGHDVVVIGGGAVAMDAARTALRLGAERVRLFCLESREQMPAPQDEIRATEEEGVSVHTGWGPAHFEVEAGVVRAVLLQRCVRVFDRDGRFAPQFDASETERVGCDSVLVAIGQRPETSWTEGSDALPLDSRGFVRCDPVTLATERPGLFAGGEVYTGPSIVVQAVANGREAAISIDRYLRGEDLLAGRPAQPRGERWAPIPEGVPKAARPEMPVLPLHSRRGFEEVELGLSESVAQQEAARCIACGSCAECMLCADACKAEAIDHRQQDEIVEVTAGSVVVATGFGVMDPAPLGEYGYGKYPNVLTSLELERLCNATGPTGGKICMRRPDGGWEGAARPASVAILHCIGSRDARYHAYCSRTCCMVALKYAHLFKDRIGHDVAVYNFFIDMRCFGKRYEEFYQRVQSEGVRMIRGKAARITDAAETPEEAGKLVVVAEDTLSQKLLRVPVDMAVLCSAMEPQKDASEVARLFGLTVGDDGFFLEEHPKLEPVSTSTAGVFLAGACQGPKDIPDAVAQAKAAASSALSLISRGEVEISPVLSSIDADLCSGCQMCAKLCPYSAIELDALRHVSVVNRAACKGCGSCAAHCPSGAAKVSHFADRQVLNEIEGLLAIGRSP